MLRNQKYLSCLHKQHLCILQACVSRKASFITPFRIKKSRDSSIGRALGYGLEDWDSRVRFPAEAGKFSLHHRVQNGSGAHPASYPMGTGGKAAGA
jgi:hypothetical protein